MFLKAAWVERLAKGSIIMSKNIQPKTTVIDLQDNAKSLELLMQEWHHSLEVQQHFNTLILRNRQIGLAIIGGLLSAAVGFFQSDKLPSSIGIALLALISLSTIFILEISYFRKLLIGAVKRTQAIDNLGLRLKIEKRNIPLFALTTYITKEVGDDPLNNQYSASSFSTKYFYGSLTISILAIIIFMLISAS